ncbi:hypothetical protein INT48_002392 [Thamnidium elegans]|uniref:Uncharacterized protein n=1 Tax=Thamnidium elegans TaxID=101142 RepID=A0A8H7SWV0_9FUNG|nr:hypothetical protein INT48_002392 [Thamnidium elegans]
MLRSTSNFVPSADIVPSTSANLYERLKIQTANYNNIKAHFGNRLRTFLNKLFKKKDKTKSLREEMQASGSSEEDIKEAIRSRVYVPCNQMKSTISRKGMPEVGLLDDQSRRKLNAFISSYPKEYVFKENSIYYDAMASPENYFKAFLKLAELSETEEMKPFACFPLRTTFIP